MENNSLNKIAILGWGSLICNHKYLHTKGDWQNDGPELKLEFLRVSKDTRLTLVIDEENGTELATLYIFSKRTQLKDVIADLRDREGTLWKWIGYIDLKNDINSKTENPKQADVCDIVEEWAEGKMIDAVVWTALKSNFKDQTCEDFTTGNVIKYLRNLPKKARENALDYFQKAPMQIETRL